MHNISPALARAKAQQDFTYGCTLEDNPYDPDTDAYAVWAEELRALLSKEDLDNFERDSQLAGCM
jgi:hypothetical protein